MIDEVDGQRLPVPVDHLRSTTFQSVQTYYTLQYFANRWFKNLRDKEKYRHLFEKNYLTGFTNEIHYTLVKRKWDPVAFWKRGTCEYFLGENFIAKKDGR